MTPRKLLLASVFVGLLCEVARADSSRSSPPPPPSSYRIDFVTPGAAKPHTILVADHSCGEHKVKSPPRELFYRVCAKPESTNVRLEIEVDVRNGKQEERSNIVILAKHGSSFEVQDTKITVKKQ